MDKREALGFMGLQHGYSLDDLNKAYKKLAKVYHPDLHKGDSDCEAKFKKLTEAKKILEENVGKNSGDKFTEEPELCPICKGTGRMNEMRRTSSGHVVVKIKCKYCRGTGKKH